MKVEYLVVTQQDGCFCNNETAFNNLLQADTQISIDKSKLKFTQKTKKLEVEYGLETDEIKDKKQRYFHIKLTAKDENQIELFTSLVRTIRKIVERLNSNISINTLWDDISRHYIIEAYPLINEVENVMRKLIQKFMLVNVGMDWVNETMPTDIKKKISEKAEKNNSKNPLEDTLHNADFIQLSGFLFDKRRDKELSQIDNLLLKKDAGDTITFGELSKDFLPISNWDRYFSSLINYKGNLLEEKWTRLYDLRNKIAHNKNFLKTELDEVKKLSSELVGRLSETIEKLDKVKLDERQKRNIFISYQQPHKPFDYSRAEEAVSHWYLLYPLVTGVGQFGTKGKSDNGIDLVVPLIDERHIAVQVKVGGKLLIERTKNKLIDRDITGIIDPTVFDTYAGIHIVLVTNEFNLFGKLELNSVNQPEVFDTDFKVTLIIGWLDSDLIFNAAEVLYFPF